MQPLVVFTTGTHTLRITATDSAGNVVYDEVMIQVEIGPTRTGDVDGDGQIDQNDIFQFSRWWYSEPNDENRPANLDQRTLDDKIDEHDLLQLLLYWRSLADED